MSTEWLAVQSFQHSQSVLAAINTLSIHLKLTLAGVADQEREEEAAEARERLASFLKEIERVVEELKQETAKPVLGADPRLRKLGESFIEAKRDRRRFHSALFRDNPAESRRLLESQQPEDQKQLLSSLEELRILIEEHINSDAIQLLGEI
jgi:hypothetical protein